MQAQIKYIQGEVNYIRDAHGNVTSRDVYGRYLINIFDDAGQPTNGNNIVVYYQQISNGVLGPVQNVTIAGISQDIYDGIVQHNGDIIDFTLTGNTQAGTPAPPIIPDVKITSVDIIKKADQAGLNATIRINATSSKQPLTYYIDNNGPFNYIFAGINDGGHTAKVVDPDGNIATLPFNVPRVNSILVSDPSVTDNGKVSRWNAVSNPIVFTYRRRDFDLLGITQDATTLKPKLAVNNDLTGVSTGDIVYIEYSPYKGAFKVLAVDGSTLVIDTPYLAPTANAGFINIDVLRPYYKISTLITYVSPLTGLFETIESTNRPINGITKANIASLLQTIVTPRYDKSDYQQVNYRDAGLSASYTIQYAEVWDGHAPEYISITTPFYVVYAARQIQQKYGGNMFDYVTQQGGVQLAKWVSDFKEPIYSVGFPFDLPFIYSEQIAGRQIYYSITLLNINRNPLNINSITGFLLNENGSYLLNQDGSKFIIARQDLVNTPIVEHVGLNRLLINLDYGDLAYYLKVQLFYTDGGAVPVTEPVIVRVDKYCGPNSLYMRWIGLNGSWNYYRFKYNQDVTLDIQNPVIIKDYVSDFENAEGVERVISKDAATKVQVYADGVDRLTVLGMQSIKYSPMVQQYINGKWQTVIVNSSTFTEYSTQNNESDIDFMFNNPSLNIQTQ